MCNVLHLSTLVALILAIRGEFIGLRQNNSPGNETLLRIGTEEICQVEGCNVACAAQRVGKVGCCVPAKRVFSLDSGVFKVFELACGCPTKSCICCKDNFKCGEKTCVPDGCNDEVNCKFAWGVQCVNEEQGQPKKCECTETACKNSCAEAGSEGHACCNPNEEDPSNKCNCCSDCDTCVNGKCEGKSKESGHRNGPCDKDIGGGTGNE